MRDAAHRSGALLSFLGQPRPDARAAALARATGTRPHIHLAENDTDVALSLERFGRTPAEYAQHLGWLGGDVWHAHCVRLDPSGITRFAATGTAVAVGLGVDGCASNDDTHLLGKARQAMLLARVAHDPADGLLFSARAALEMATLGGARALGRDDIGSIAAGMAADLVAFDLCALAFAGALYDPLAALLFCAPQIVSLSVIDGRIVVGDGQLVVADLLLLIERHNALVRILLAA